jgi:hypothetical protein
MTLVGFVLAMATALGQNNDNSPYSRIGIGEMADFNLNHTRQMGGMSAAYLDGHHLNPVNPASYSFLNATAFDIGFFGKRTWLSDEKNKNAFWSGNLEYIALAFPLRNPINEAYEEKKKDWKLGMAFALMNHSNVNYNIRISDSLPNIGKFDDNYLGGGGSYKVLWGNSARYKNFSAGINLGYIFGKVKYEHNLIYDPAEFAYNSFLNNTYNLRGFTWNGGLLYTKVLNQKEIDKDKKVNAKRVSLGLTFKSSDRINTSSNFVQSLVQNLPGQVLNIDTVRFSADTAGRALLPSELGFGAMFYSGEKHAIGFNVNTAAWSNYFNEATSEVAGTMKNSSKISIGGYYRPNYKSFTRFFDRVYYRYGMYYENDPRVIKDEQIKTYGVTLGMGMPVIFQRKISHLNLGANFGIKGEGTPVSERFIKLSLGMTFNDDEWFLKRKYD